jgi:hypothetical protein
LGPGTIAVHFRGVIVMGKPVEQYMQREWVKELTAPMKFAC